MEANSRPKSRFMGHFDGLNNGMISGWSVDTRNNNSPPQIHIIIDGQEIDTIRSEGSRPDVKGALSFPHDRTGFVFALPVQFLDGQPHDLSLRFDDRSSLVLSPDTGGVVHIFAEQSKPVYKSYVDGVKQGALRGWIFRERQQGAPVERVLLAILVDGVKIAQTRADRYRGDVAANLGCDPNCGFEVPVPQYLRGNSQRKVQIIVVPDGIELSGSPFVTSFADDAFESKIIDITREIDDLYRRMAALRQDLRDLIPRRPYDLGDYNRWAQKYYKVLEEQVSARRGRGGQLSPRPLVSVLCPVWRPLATDFTAAIESVLGQTYENWELILVDDSGKCKETSGIINDYTKKDRRIRSICLKKNIGISGATNVAIDAASGEYLAFFDHDDLLVNVALEVMVSAAIESGAGFLYSDEDKIDQSGYYLEPNLKPDFNYRYLLGCNYICHFTMMRADVVRKIGHLRSDYDGAQDHDFVLRATEVLSPSDIYHVPEILYHWRKTPNSTAADVSQKAYAITAGVNCVSDHLKRIGFSANVSSVRGLTLYGVDWNGSAFPEVSIIIPFKDQVEITKKCVDLILNKTNYGNYKIILVNNWSIEKETKDFISLYKDNIIISFIDVEEPFNYSKMNNLAVSKVDSEYIVFMNNDVFVDDPQWLHLMMGEAQAAKDIGAVGAKLLYPNDTIQHAGVVVGPSGIAAHVHRGESVNEYGYIGRTMLTHEVTAVTAALMLVKRSVFEEVGGFDEEKLTVAYNDVDLCLKIRAANYRIIFSAETVAYHHESLSRGTDDKPEHETRFFMETQAMLKRWRGHPLFERDPSYPRYFTVDQQPFFNLIDPEELSA